MFDRKTILVTGGTGSFGKAFTKYVLQNHRPNKIIVFSRDEFKQYQMQQWLSDSGGPVRFFLGDIRDKDRLYRAFDGVDMVVHAAALKQVPAAEYNPFEAVKTNILGAENIIEAAIDRGVRQVIALSTDKAVAPINLYGSTKLAMEKLFIAANSYVGKRETSFTVVRYGNVIGSRGSVIPFFLDLIAKGVKKLPITDERMTRFWITLQGGVDLVCRAARDGEGGEIFIPKIPSTRVTDLVTALGKDLEYEIIGIRPGEKLHESLISEDDGPFTVDMGDIYVVMPQYRYHSSKLAKYDSMPKMPEGFFYRSDTNKQILSVDEIKEMIKGISVE